jgi:hypothetical protein
MTKAAGRDPLIQRDSVKEASETLKNLLDILKSIVALILIATIVFLVSCDRPRLKAMAHEMGIEKASGFGVEVDLSTSDALPRSDAAMKDAQAQLAALRKQYSAAVQALKDTQAQLAAGGARVSPSVKQSVATVLQNAPATLQSTQRTAAVLENAQTKTSTAIAKLPGAGDSSLGFGVVFGGDSSEDAARDQLKLAERLPSGSRRLFQRQGSYRSVVVFPTRDTAMAALPRIKALNRYSAGAYVVTLASWCPGADLSQNPVVCS